jgi:hypothetical protein
MNLLITLVNRDKPLDGSTAEELAAFCERYPYCQPSQILLARNLLLLNRDPYGKQLNRALAYSTDRKRFQAFIADESPEELPAGAGSQTVRPPAHGEVLSDGPAGDADGSPGQPAARPSHIRKQQEIIDRFLSANPRIEPGKAAPNEETIGAEALEEPEDLVSETLAEVLARQGQREKAIRVYEKLSLNFPEKSSYFAKKIEDLKNT